MDTPDFQGFAVEYASLVGIQWREEYGEMDINIQCPVSSWYYKRVFINIMQALRLKELVSNPCIEYLLTLNFLGVSSLQETLLSKGHTIGSYDGSNTDWIRDAVNDIFFVIDSIHNVKLDNDLYRFYLYTEGLELAFNYQDCIILQKCIE